MYREIEQDLVKWKNKPNRKPLLLRGARQVGKTYTVEKFGEQHFDDIAVVNFELDENFKACFNTLYPDKIIEALARHLKKRITPGQTLLFLDEIQEHPKVILSLRYFKEKMPKLHVIAAGSLLEFAIKKADFRMPVGRIESLYMAPLSFREYLLATKNELLIEDIRKSRLNKPVSDTAHALLNERLGEYIELGGMPAVLQRRIEDYDIISCYEEQAQLVSEYENDFGKYDSSAKVEHMVDIFRTTPEILSEQFKYVKVNPNIRSRELKPALDALIDAGLIAPVYHTAASGVPLRTTKNRKKFKLLMLDVGLARYASSIGSDIPIYGEKLLLNSGNLTEQFVGQELTAHALKFQKPELFFWSRETPSSSAEVDYVINLGANIFPIEVKSGTTGRLKSLKVFMEEKGCKFGIRISERPLSFENDILSIPLYMVSEIYQLIQDIS